MSVPHYIPFALLESTGNPPEYIVKTKQGSLKETAQQNCHRHHHCCCFVVKRLWNGRQQIGAVTRCLKESRHSRNPCKIINIRTKIGVLVRSGSMQNWEHLLSLAFGACVQEQGNCPPAPWGGFLIHTIEHMARTVKNVQVPLHTGVMI